MLDGKDKDDQSVESDDDEEDDYGEEGEFALNEDELEIPQDVLDKLDPETREKYEKGEINQEELLDFLNKADGFDDLGEEGEFDMDGEEGEEQL